MKRREFILAAAGGVLLPKLGLAAQGGWIDYKPEVIQSLLDEGKTVFVDYHAVWCSTCKAQRRVVERLRAENPAYDAAMEFVNVDWDEYARHPVSTDRAIPRRSTLLVLRGTKELGRIVAGTSESEIKALLDAGL
ncbi:MAG TPA: thioredoxin family protein [Paracoccaceae bacterium]|nr:thioredoxin family protein [Paracoccaceae bacterium]